MNKMKNTHIQHPPKMNRKDYPAATPVTADKARTKNTCLYMI